MNSNTYLDNVKKLIGTAGGKVKTFLGNVGSSVKTAAQSAYDEQLKEKRKNNPLGYTGGDFNTAYKAYFGREYNPAKGFSTEGMNDTDARILNALYSAHVANERDKEIMDTNVGEANAAADRINKQLAAERSVAGQQASITHERLKKYLPMQAKAQGLGGTYAETSAGLRAYNSYMNALNSASATHATAVADNERERDSRIADYKRIYGESVRDRDLEASDKASGIWDAYLKQDKQDKEKAANDRYDLAVSLVEQSTGTTVDAVLAGIDTSALTETHAAMLKEYAAAVAKANAKAEYDKLTESGATYDEINSFVNSTGLSEDSAISKEVADYKATSPTGVAENATIRGLNGTNRGTDFRIFIDGNKYPVQIGDKVNKADVLAAAGKVKDEIPFLYDGEVYINVDGATYRVESRWLDKRWSDGSGPYYDKLKEALTPTASTTSSGN